MLLITLLALSFHLLGAEGETCQEAEIAIEGSNETPNSPYWYSFTIPLSGSKWVISSVNQTSSDTYLFVYDGCNGNLIAENDDFGDGVQSEVKLYGLEEGETILIYWSDEYSSNAFNWSISSSDNIIPGEDCSAPANAEIGLNSVPYIEDTEFFWYSFTPTDPDSKIVITSTQNIEVYIVKGICAGYDFEVLGYGDGDLTVTNAKMGEELLIVWFREDPSEFEWNLAVEELQPGEGCSTAFEAQVGVNELTVAEPFQPNWYSFTVPSPDTKIVINHDIGDVEFEAYRKNCSDDNYLDYSYFNGEITIKELYEGETIYLKWTVGDVSPFEWSLLVQEVQEGESCGKAIPIEIGGSYTLSTIGGVNKYWYEFTAPAEAGKMIIIQTFQDANFDLYGGTCNDLIWKTSGYSSGSYFAYQPGEQLYLSWWPQINGDLSWEMFAPEIQPGDICTMPKVAEEGTFNEELNLTGEHWYSFTMPDPDSKLVISSADEIYPSVYRNGCSELDWVDNSFNGTHNFYDIPVGEEVLIHLYGSDYSWDLSVESLEPGESCSSAELVPAGVHEVPETALNTYWFEFIAPEDTEKSIIIDSDVDAYISVLQGGCQDPDYIKGNYQLLGFRNNHPGETLHIRWDLYQGGGFEWELIFQDPQPGEDCESAILVEEGDQTINDPNGTGEHWYRFVMPDENAKVTISTNSGFEATVLKGNCVTNSFIDYAESVAIDDLAKGDEILIIWNTIGFVWNIKVDALPKISVTPEEIQSTAPKFGSVSEEITINNEGLGPLYYNISASYGLAFNGRNGYVEFPHSSELNPEDGITISLWLYLSEDINCNSANNWRFILSKGFHWQDGSYEAILEEDRSLTWRVNTVGGQSWYVSTNPVPIGSWTHLAFSYDASSSTHKIFINGAEDETSHTIESGSGDIMGNNQPFVIGSQISYESCADGAGVIPGSIDEVMVWDEALNEQAIRELMLMPPSNSDQGLVAFWNFDNVVNNEVTDQSNNENAGYVIGAKQSFGAPVNQWINIPVPYGTVNAENSLGVDIDFNAVKLEQGTYQSQIIIFSNDPSQEFIEVPVTFIVDGVLGTDNVENHSFSLDQNYPNPMSSGTIISYQLEKGGYVNLSVYNMLGQKVRTLVDQYQYQGPYEIKWSGEDDNNFMLMNGLYIYRLQMKNPDNKVGSHSARLIIQR